MSQATRLDETCSCGAKFSMTSEWTASVLEPAVKTWRQDHVCTNRPVRYIPTQVSQTGGAVIFECELPADLTDDRKATS